MSIQYLLYARKSSESEDRQMASIDDQIAEMKRYAKERNLKVAGIISESKSAKAPGRKGFQELLDKVQKGEAKGILCWKLNRLARNSVDGGQIIWMLEQNIIQHIQTFGRDYKPSDNLLLMYVEFGMANQFVKDLSADVKRGLRRKAERGWLPQQSSPMGYIHNPLRTHQNTEPEIIPDPERFPVIKRLWNLMLTGEYTIADIRRKGTALGLVNLKKRPYSYKAYEKLFSNEFYCGYFTWKNDQGGRTRYEGKHKRAGLSQGSTHTWQ